MAICDDVFDVQHLHIGEENDVFDMRHFCIGEEDDVFDVICGSSILLQRTSLMCRTSIIFNNWGFRGKIGISAIFILEINIYQIWVQKVKFTTVNIFIIIIVCHYIVKHAIEIKVYMFKGWFCFSKFGLIYGAISSYISW